MKLAFIREKKSKKYLGISITPNGDDAEFCNSTTVSLCSWEPPHAFASRANAEKCLKEQVDWFNSSPQCPMQKDYDLENCEIIEVVLP